VERSSLAVEGNGKPATEVEVEYSTSGQSWPGSARRKEEEEGRKRPREDER
jgi:hypothetical protein